jgi:hypothetical protein
VTSRIGFVTGCAFAVALPAFAAGGAADQPPVLTARQAAESASSFSFSTRSTLATSSGRSAPSRRIGDSCATSA